MIIPKFENSGTLRLRDQIDEARIGEAFREEPTDPRDPEVIRVGGRRDKVEYMSPLIRTNDMKEHSINKYKKPYYPDIRDRFIRAFT